MTNRFRLKKLVAVMTAAILIVSMSQLAMAETMHTEVATVIQFKPLGPDIAQQAVPIGTSLDELDLPAALEAVVEVQAALGFGHHSSRSMLPFGFTIFGIGGGAGAEGAAFMLPDPGYANGTAYGAGGACIEYADAHCEYCEPHYDKPGTQYPPNKPGGVYPEK